MSLSFICDILEYNIISVCSLPEDASLNGQLVLHSNQSYALMQC